MIALSVLSTILVMSTVILIQIGGLYSKGVNSANLQNANRSVMSDLSGTIQLSGVAPGPCSATAVTCYTSPDPADMTPAHQNPVTYNGVPIYAYCINTIRYSYVLNREQGTDSSNVVTPHVLWRDTITSPASCWPLNISQNAVTADDAADGSGQPSKGYNLVPDHVRLTRLKVIESPANSGIHAIDVWMAYGDNDLVHTDSTGHNICEGGKGTQFCAISHLSTTVTRRVN